MVFRQYHPRSPLASTVALALIVISIFSCDHPYDPSTDLASEIDRNIAVVSIEGYSIEVDSKSVSACLPGKVAAVSVRFSNSRNVAFSVAITRKDDSLAEVPTLVSIDRSSAVFSFIPTAAAAGKVVPFSLAIAVAGGSLADSSGELSIPCGIPDATGVAYTVSYDANGASGTLPAAVSSVSGGSITVGSAAGLSRSGYSFVGWNTRADGSGTAYAAGATLVVSSDVLLYAQWSSVVVSYTVTYDANGGTGTLPASSGSSVPSGSAVLVESAGSLSRSGYSFAGWNTAAGGGGTSYAAGATLVISSDVTLYAQWAVVIPSYTVTYDMNGGTGTLPASSGSAWPAGTALSVETATGIARSGYVFSGWNTAAGGGGASYAAGSTLVVSLDVTLYAQWTVVFTVTYNLNGGTGTVPAGSGSVYPYGTDITVAGSVGISRSGYLFTGWNTASDGSGVDWNFGVTMTVTTDVALYAVWVPASTVTFSANGGTGSLGSVTVITGADAVLPGGAGLSLSGQSFTGWNTASDGSGTQYAAGATMTVSSNVTLYAQWQNASLAANLAAISAGGTVALSGHLSDAELVTLKTAVAGASSALTLDLSAVTNISFGGNMFINSVNLVAVTVPDTLISLPQGCFQGCTSLTSLTLDSALQSLDMWCVRGCTSLTHLTVPANVSVLGESCFYQSGLAGNSGVITFEQSDAEWYNFSGVYNFGSMTTDIFGYASSPANTATFQIRVPASAETAYEALPLMSRYAAKIIGY
jgi:uncharacterized repeat protein (TIGR02543 family)